MHRTLLIIYDVGRLLMMALTAVWALFAIYLIVWAPDFAERAKGIMEEEMARQTLDFCDKYGPPPKTHAHVLCTIELKRIRDEDRDRVHAASPW